MPSSCLPFAIYTSRISLFTVREVSELSRSPTLRQL
jgi:hypothetical protein